MPIKKAAFKALRQTKKRTRRNRAKKEEIKKLGKRIKRLLEQKKRAEAEKLIPLFYKAADKAAKTRVFHANKASRLKARLTKRIKKVSDEG